MEKIKIYCLYDYNECKIRYIGRTKKEILEYRLIEHITKAKYFEKYYPNKKYSHKVNWIKSLLKEGKEPKIKLLTTVDGWKESHIFERNLINKYKGKYNLTNADDRGEGELNKIITEDIKKSISKKLKKNYELGYENPVNKAVDVYDKDGNYIISYKSIEEASKNLNISRSGIDRVLLGTHKQNKGYQFKLSNDTEKIISKIVYKPKDVSKLNKIVEVTDLITNEKLIFNSIKECSIYFNLPSPSISQILTSKKKLYKSRYSFTCPRKTDLKLETPEEDNQLPTIQSLNSSIEVQRLDDSKDIQLIHEISAIDNESIDEIV
jgi:hypothetical protein